MSSFSLLAPLSPPRPPTLAPAKVPNVFWGKSSVLLSGKADNVLKIDLSDVWLTAFSIEDIFLTEEKEVNNGAVSS